MIILFYLYIFSRVYFSQLYTYSNIQNLFGYDIKGRFSGKFSKLQRKYDSLLSPSLFELLSCFFVYLSSAPCQSLPLKCGQSSTDNYVLTARNSLSLFICTYCLSI